MSRRTEISDHLIHAGAGTSLAIAWLGVIPGFIPTLALTAFLGAVLVVPAVISALAATLLAIPPYLLWRLAARSRRRRVSTGRRSLPPVLPAAKTHNP